MTRDDKENALAAVNALFKAIPKSRRMENIGVLNEALVYIERH